MSDKAEVIAYHGWGFDQTCWHQWRDYFVRSGISFETFDRGYFNQPAQPQFSIKSCVKILFIHSYGLHLCPVNQFQKTNLLVIFSGFQAFHPYEQKAKHYSQRILTRMIRGFQKDPQKVLMEFHTNSYLPVEMGEYSLTKSLQLENGFEKELLLKDLQDLDRAIFELESIKSIDNIVILQGDTDGIVAAGQAEDLADSIDEITGQSVHFFIIQGAGHALPFTHFGHCCLHLQTLINTL